MGAAGERRDIEPSPRQHARDTFDVCRLAAMRGTGERELLIAKRVTVGGARFYKRERLQRLDRRTRKYRLCNVANGQHRRTVRINDGNGAAMAALYQRTTGHLDKNRIGHFQARNFAPGQSAAPARWYCGG